MGPVDEITHLGSEGKWSFHAAKLINKQRYETIPAD
jgi:hypothetical protein